MKKKTIDKSIASVCTLAILTASASPVFAESSYIKKDETVYTILKKDGTVEKNIVSEWLSGDGSLDKINDESILKDIKNVKGDEKPTIDGDKVTWDTTKEDLYYQGKTDKQLPITTDIEYELNGRSVTADEIKGQSGNLKVTIRLKNNESRNVRINGENRTVYVPFVTATEILMPRKNFKNIKSNTGKVVDDGKTSAITAISSPGLESSLNMGGDFNKLFDKIGSTITIEADAYNFEAPEIMIAATPDISALDDIDSNTNMNDISNMIDKLKKSGKELLNGTEQLYKGTSTLANNYEKFDAGTQKLSSGIGTLTDGVGLMGRNIPVLSDGAQKLMNGIERLNAGQDKFTTGVSMFIENTENVYSAYSDIDNGIKNAAAGASKLSGALSGASSGGSISELSGSISKNKELASGIVSAAQTIINDENASEESKAAAQKIVSAAQTSIAISSKQEEAVGNAASAVSSAKSGLAEASTAAKQLSSGLNQLSEGSSQYKSKFGQLIEAGNVLRENSGKLEGSTDKLYEGSQKLYNGTTQLQSGANQLVAGGSELKKGSDLLSSNSKKILSGTKELQSGSKKLYDGVKQANDKVNSEVSSKTAKIKDLEKIIDTKDVLVDLSREYNNYAGIGEDMNGDVKFIMKVNTDDESNNGTEEKQIKEEATGIKGLLQKIIKRDR
ncbi:hypothetical protein [Peptacetobacter sp.]|uniref:hypothetical protein n=1 Tax=Peptacetobacter sp. TaxID=2991975 RepID=UPI0026086BAC|nr:hypothetical protein [Peptacetobacter sp.]